MIYDENLENWRAPEHAAIFEESNFDRAILKLYKISHVESLSEKISAELSNPVVVFAAILYEAATNSRVFFYYDGITKEFAYNDNQIEFGWIKGKVYFAETSGKFVSGYSSLGNELDSLGFNVPWSLHYVAVKDEVISVCCDTDFDRFEDVKYYGPFLSASGAISFAEKLKGI